MRNVQEKIAGALGQALENVRVVVKQQDVLIATVTTKRRKNNVFNGINPNTSSREY